MAARLMGYGTVVLEPDPQAPAANVADEHLVAAYDDEAALDRLASTCAVITTEFENPPATSLDRLARSTGVAPSAAAVAIAQDRRTEKRFLADAGIPIAPWAVVETVDAPAPVRFPAILKTARLGYDGKGQTTIVSIEQLPDVWASLGGGTCVLEEALSLDAEVSVIVARTADGRTATYEVAENLHVNGILDLTVVLVASPRRSPNGRRSWRSRSPTPSGTSGCWPSSCSWSAMRCTSTSWRRGHTTAGTGRSTRPAPASSNNRSERCAGSVSATRR